MVETRITVGADPAAAVAAKAAVEGMQDTGQRPDREHLQRLKEQAAREARTGQFAGGGAERHPLAPPPPSAQPREDLDSVLVQVPARPDHPAMEVLVGPPPGVSLTIRVLNYYGGRECIAADEMVTRALMSVREIDGRAWPPIMNSVDRDSLGHVLGDDGITIVLATYRTYWPPLRMAELPVLKKNPR